MSNFNHNLDGIAPNMPCVKDCPNRNPYCRANCQAYKEWQLVQKQYSNKVKWIRKNNGMGVPWHCTKAR